MSDYLLLRFTSFHGTSFPAMSAASSIETGVVLNKGLGETVQEKNYSFLHVVATDDVLAGVPDQATAK